MKLNTIKAGYRLTVNTWENDGDNCNSRTEDGLTESGVRFWVDIFKAHRSKNSGDGFIGNIYDPNEDEIEKYNAKIASIMREHPNAVFGIFGVDLVDNEISDKELADNFADIGHDWTLSSSEFHSRVVEDWVVEFTPVQLILGDVTDDFK